MCGLVESEAVWKGGELEGDELRFGRERNVRELLLQYVSVLRVNLGEQLLRSFAC